MILLSLGRAAMCPMDSARSGRGGDPSWNHGEMRRAGGPTRCARCDRSDGVASIRVGARREEAVILLALAGHDRRDRRCRACRCRALHGVESRSPRRSCSFIRDGSRSLIRERSRSSARVALVCEGLCETRARQPSARGLQTSEQCDNRNGLSLARDATLALIRSVRRAAVVTPFVTQSSCGGDCDRTRTKRCNTMAVSGRCPEAR
jgi:hypothetical protein